MTDRSHAIGWKVMRFDPTTNELVSGADSRLRFPCTPGSSIEMPGQGVWMGLCPRYVKDHYRAHDHEVLLELAFDPENILEGNLTDREPEFTTRAVQIISITHLEPDEDA